ncbi:uncharacterized protein LOC116166535 [Photinus pyralis]|uniref:uncharacterized protein LOC116166535 n=1 Tax=Photinus pyralis TaxID=7054 RepID=UPI0012670B7B|nr:uncharacterized protein LOC116166535 [Photinus pyralis]
MNAAGTSAEKGKYRRSCVVPMCTNSVRSTPNKIFFSLPKREDVRRKWCKAMKRDTTKNAPLSSISGSNICEDHFNLEEDLDNYWQFKLMKNVRPRLKKGVVPHLFLCQKTSTGVPVASSATLKRRRCQRAEEAISGLETRPFEPQASSSDPIQTPLMEEAQTPDTPYKHNS